MLDTLLNSGVGGKLKGVVTQSFDNRWLVPERVIPARIICDNVGMKLLCKGGARTNRTCCGCGISSDLQATVIGYSSFGCF